MIQDDNEDKPKVVKVHRNKHYYYMDRWLVDNLDQHRDLIKYNNDFVYVVDGKTGTGKTHFITGQIAYYLDPNFRPETHVCYDMDKFEELLENLPRYSAIVIDESFYVLAKRKRMNPEIIRMIDNLMTCRIYNKFIFIIIPDVRELDNYITRSRAICLIRTYYGKGLSRGNFMYYNHDRLRRLCSSNYTQRGKAKWNFLGRFTSFYPFDMDKLDKIKRETLLKRYKRKHIKIDKK